MPHPRHLLEDPIDDLAAAVQAEPEELRIWAVAALANRLGLVVVVTPSGDPLEAITEVGTAFADIVFERLEDEPGDDGP